MNIKLFGFQEQFITETLSIKITQFEKNGSSGIKLVLAMGY